MPTYKYRAKKGPEEPTEGIIEAQSEREAIDKISQMGYFPLSVQPEKITAQPQEAALPGKYSYGIRSSEITIFSRQLASLLKSGVPILASLNIIAEQCENRRF